MAAQEFPWEIKNVTEDEDKTIKKYYKDYVRPFIRVGPKGYIANAGYGDHAAEIYNLEVRPDDIWVTTFSRSGTTWLQELVWLVANNLDFETARAVPLSKRFAYIEYPTQRAETREESTPTNPNAPRATFEDFRSLPSVTSPRYVKSHLPLSLLPPKLLETAKVFYIARDPRDVAVSYHFAHKLFRYFDDNVEFKEFWDLFKQDLIMHTPIFPHVEEAWQKRDHPNMMFLFYEEMQNDLRNIIERVCKFLDKEYSEEQQLLLAEYLNFNNMKQKTMVSKTNEDGSEVTFFRKGKAGGWVNYFDEEMTKESEEWLENYLKTTDLRYPKAIK
ncbi:sulfotransferase 1C3 [Helicoverpa armigera]|uniref:sulfotransferase 1C3 n=1 Tax=Helicoverpa armigera TaxID=29058 RepID=UPI003082ACD6